MDILTQWIQCIMEDLTPRFHIYLPTMVGILIIFFIFKKKESTKKKKYTIEEEDDIISQWEPIPLVDTTESDVNDNRVVESKFKKQVNGVHLILHSEMITLNEKIGKNVTINGKKCLNLASLSFLGLSENQDIEDSAIKSINKYGVGSCGPRGFYGTVDVHLELEERLAKFMGVEEAVVYSYGFSTIASAIPAYAKRGDLIFVDEEVNYSIQKGIDASRSNVKYFKHNDMEDLERILAHQQMEDLKDKKRAAKIRRFLIVEGIYMKTGEICPLSQLISLRKKYKLRIFIDESISFGTLGPTGRGVTEYHNIPMIEVDLIMASMECALASVGGFCVGSTFIVEHQRLSGLGYCFSASLPPLLTSAAMKALDIMENNPQIVLELQVVAIGVHASLCKKDTIINHFFVKGDPLSPIKHLQPKIPDIKFLDQIVEKCEEKNIAVARAAFLKNEKKAVYPSIRISVNRLLTKLDIFILTKVLEESILEVTFRRDLGLVD